MYIMPRFSFHQDSRAPYGFRLIDRETGRFHDPVEIARHCEVEIVYDKVADVYWMQGEEVPWYCPIDNKDRVHDFATAIGVKVRRLRYDQF